MINIKNDVAGFISIEELAEDGTTVVGHVEIEIPTLESISDIVITCLGTFEPAHLRPNKYQIVIKYGNEAKYSFDVRDVKNQATWLPTRAGLLVAITDIQAFA